MFQLSCRLGRGGKPAAPVTLLAVSQKKIWRKSMEQNRRRIEPFCLFGTDSIIYTKEEAAKVAVDNSYYFKE